MKKVIHITLFYVLLFVIFAGLQSLDHTISFEQRIEKQKSLHRYLYVAVPGIRNYLEYGGHGLLVYDIDDNYRLIKRIKTAGVDDKGTIMNLKGIAASLYSNCVYISTLKTLICVDLLSEKVIWEKAYEGGCDRMSITPDGKTIFLPSLEGPHWNVVDAKTGEVIRKIILNSGAHNTVCGPGGTNAYLAGLKSPYLTVANTRDTSTKKVGPFNASIRPFTINGKETLCFVNVNDLLGFEVGNINTGKKLYSVEVKGYQKGAVKRHGCPSHGIALTKDEKELWLADAANESLHIFDITTMPAKQKESVKVRDQPGWITVSISGKNIYSSTGDIIDTKKRKIIATLKDENGSAVQSEKMVEIHFNDNKPVAVGDQFGIGGLRKK